MLIFRRVSLFLWLLILCVGVTFAQTAEVTHNVNLRSDPSTAHPPIRLLLPQQIQLLEAGQTNGYFHVRTMQNEEGWVWSPNVHVLPVTPTPAPTPPGPTATPAPCASTTASEPAVPTNGSSSLWRARNWNVPRVSSCEQTRCRDPLRGYAAVLFEHPDADASVSRVRGSNYDRVAGPSVTA
jgi:hypothetical protein